jgi:hypothetical protein
MGEGRRVVQQGSTATCLDSGGLLGTCRDGDLRWWTSVDGLPLDGMQEVRGSNPRSSTGQKRNSKSRAASTAAKYSSGDRARARTQSSDHASRGAEAAGTGRRCGGARAACSAVTRMGSSLVTVVTTWPRWRSGVRGAADPGLTLAACAGGQQGRHPVGAWAVECGYGGTWCWCATWLCAPSA